jgi:hypothetical protein
VARVFLMPVSVRYSTQLVASGSLACHVRYKIKIAPMTDKAKMIYKIAY